MPGLQQCIAAVGVRGDVRGIDLQVSREELGPSGGVSLLARHLAGRMGMDAVTCERIEVAGLLHDIGKLQIPGEIIEADGALAADEFPASSLDERRLCLLLRLRSSDRRLTSTTTYMLGNVALGARGPAATVFPNPASDAVNVAFEMPADGTAYLQLLDLNGRVVRDRDMDMEKGPRTLSLRVQDLQAGTYDLRLITTTNGGIQNLRFIKD